MVSQLPRCRSRHAAAQTAVGHRPPSSRSGQSLELLIHGALDARLPVRTAAASVGAEAVVRDGALGPESAARLAGSILLQAERAINPCAAGRDGRVHVAALLSGAAVRGCYLSSRWLGGRWLGGCWRGGRYLGSRWRGGRWLGDRCLDGGRLSGGGRLGGLGSLRHSRRLGRRTRRARRRRRRCRFWRRRQCWRLRRRWWSRLG